ncbi:MAG: hypothetical protein MH472_14655, partial [Bacteroidia bacterium]|nr:hypothetical protein [Bacteroidia bacterium]
NMDNKTLTSNTQYVLKDFVTQNDAIRIPIPNTSPQQFLWIENHQKEHFLDEKIFYKDASPMGKGIYAFISGNGNDCNNLSTFVFDWNTSSTTNMFKVLSAKGNKDYSYTISSHNPYGGYFNTFLILADNPISGQTSVTAIRNDFNSNEIIEYCLNPNSHNGCPDDQEGMWVEDNSLTWAYSGSSDDAFDVGDELSISGILPVLNYPQYNLGTNQVEEFILNDLSVKIISYNSTTGEYTLDISTMFPYI